MIECSNITKTYTTGDVKATVLKDVSFTIEQGEFVAIMGPSGSGKSTLMHILGMLDTPTTGAYRFRDRDVSELSGDELAEIRVSEIGFVFQAFNLLKRATVLRNVMLPFLYAETPHGEREAKAQRALQQVGLDDDHLWSHLSNQLSGGQMQRVAIARALVNEPGILFADEPTGNLDSKSGEMVLDLFSTLNREHGHTIILITHEMELAEYADRVILIRDGEITSDKRNLRKKA
ncbi:ABC transporter ATP-binding protein [Patescibacteria group bacterium]|nr:ABC transporter ATP-binding protein [Patescibacteria group bacterium]